MRRRHVRPGALIRRSVAGGACLAMGAVAMLIGGGAWDAGLVVVAFACYAITLACLAGIAWSLVGGEL